MAASFSASFSCSFQSRRTLSMTLQTRSMCHCSSNSASSSSASLTTSLTRIFWLAQLVAQLEDLLDRDRRVEHDLQHAPLAVLDALGDLDLALAGEQRDRPHLAQVHAHRVVGLGVAVASSSSSGSSFLASTSLLFLLLGVRLGVSLLGDLQLRRRIDDLDALAGEGRQPVVHLIRRDDVLRHVLVDLVVGQEALRLAHGDELALLALALLGGGRRRLLGGAVLGRLGRARDLLDVVVHVVAIGFVLERVVFHSRASAGLP